MNQNNNKGNNNSDPSDEINGKKIEQLLEMNNIKSSNQLVLESIKSLFPWGGTEKKNTSTNSNETVEKNKTGKSTVQFSKKSMRVLKILFFIMLSLIISIILALSKDTIVRFSEIVTFLNEIQLALLGITFTGFAFFQAILSDVLLERMFMRNIMAKKDGNLFTSINNSFYFLMVLYVLCIFINVLAILFLKSVDNNWVLTENDGVNMFLSGCIMTVYLFFQLLVIYQIKYFMYNLLKTFNGSIVDKLMSK